MPRLNHNLSHSNANNNQQQTNLLTRIEENTKNININVDTLEVNTDGLEGLITTTNTKLAGGLPSALTASGRLKVESHITDYSTETKQDTVIGHLATVAGAVTGTEMQVDVLTMPTVAVTLSGGATEAKQDDGITHLATIAGDTTSINSKITACNTGAVTVSGSALPSGASTASLQGGGLPSALSSDNLKVSLKESIAVGVTNTTLTNLNNCIDSNELQVDIVSSALPSGAATESSLSSLNGKVTACNTGAVVVSSSALPSGAATQSTLNDAEVHLGNIETSVQLIDDVVGTDGSTGPGKCISIGGTESGGNIQELLVDSAGHLQIDVLSAPSTAVTNTTLTNLNNCIDSNELQVDIVSSALPSGAATQSTLNDAEVHLGSIDAKVTQGNDATLTNAQQVLIYGKNGTGDLKPIHITNNGDVEVEIADFVKGQAAMAASFPVTIASNQSNLNVNQNIAGTDVDSNSGNKSAATQRVVIADDDVNLSAIKTAVELLDDAIGTDGSTGPGKCISIGGTESGGNIQELLVDSAGHLQIDVLSAPSTAVTNTTLTNLNNCIDSNELQVDIVASALPSGAATASLQGAGLPSALSLDNLKVSLKETITVPVSNVKTTGEWLATSTVIGDDNYSASLDCSSFREVRVFGKNASSIGPASIDVMGSQSDLGTYYKIGEITRETIEIGGTPELHYEGQINMPTNFIKLYNNSGSGTTLELDYVGFSV